MSNLEIGNTHLQKERAVGRMMAIITGLYFLTYLPTFILSKVNFMSSFMWVGINSIIFLGLRIE